MKIKPYWTLKAMRNGIKHSYKYDKGLAKSDYKIYKKSGGTLSYAKIVGKTK